MTISFFGDFITVQAALVRNLFPEDMGRVPDKASFKCHGQFYFEETGWATGCC